MIWTDADRTARAMRSRQRMGAVGGYPRWDRNKEEELREYCVGNEKLSASQIGVKLGYSRSAVIGKAHRMGLQLPVNHGGRPSVRDTTAARSKITVKKAHEAIKEGSHGFADTLDPITDEMPPRGSQCRFIRNEDPHNPDYCPNKKQLGSYCADHYLLTCGDKEAARKVIASLK